MVRKYNIGYNAETDPFDISEDDVSKERTWDWYFEQHGHIVKKETFKQYAHLLDIVVKNRCIINHVFLVLSCDVPNMNNKINYVMIEFIRSFFLRMMKTSKVIQDTSVEGCYAESKSLLRNNFERAVLIEYFISNEDELQEFLSGKNKEDKKVMSKYSIKRLANSIGRKYEEYQYLCKYAHAYMYDLDTMNLKLGKYQFTLMKAYNTFDYKRFMWINYMNNKLLLETFCVIFNYFKRYIPKKELKEDNLKNVLSNVKELLFILIDKNEDKTKYPPLIRL